jgi:hypothetical protein
VAEEKAPARTPTTLAISKQMFAVMRALRDRRDPKEGLFKHREKAAIDQAINGLKARRLIMHTNVVAEPWKLTNLGEELLRLRDLGEKRLEERQRRAWDGYRGSGR